MPLNTGDVLNNRYRIVKLLGQGGFGAVYRAWDTNLDRARALKENLETSPEAQRQFKLEAQILSDLTHPNLPRVNDHFVIPGQGQYLVMDYIEGGDLHSMLEASAGAGLPESQVLPWIIQVCEALAYLHSQNPPVIHRDIKPANIKITPQGKAFLVDFGIAKLYDPARRTTQGARSVTPGYAPFEQYGQSSTDARSDIYALGATLYHLLTGQTPVDSIDRMRGIELVLPRQLNPSISPGLETTLFKALEVMPEKRYQSAAELLHALQSCQAGGEVSEPVAPTVGADSMKTIAVPMASSTPISAKDSETSVQQFQTPPKARKRSSSRRLVLGIIALIAVLLVGGGLVIWMYSENKPAAVSESPKNTPTTYILPSAIPIICTDAIGCIELKPEDPIHIAYALVISGPDASLGIDARNGAELAIDDKGAKLLGHFIQFDGVDEGCTAEGGQAAGINLAAEPTIVAILGTSCSSALRVAMPYWSKAGLTVISPSNTAVELTQPGNEHNHPGYLRTAHSDAVQGEAAARFAREKLGIKKAATIHDGSNYAQQLQQVFADTFRELGGEIITQQPIDPNQNDMSGVLTSIAAGAPDLIYLPIFIQAGSQIVRQARQTPGLEKTYLMGADGLYSPPMVESTGDAIAGLLVSGPDFSGFGTLYQDRFVPMYREKYGVADPISLFHAHAYDAMNMIFSCIEKMAQIRADGSILIGRQALRDCMYAISGFPGLTGVLSCSDTGDCADPVIAVYKYEANSFPPTKIWP